MQDFFFQISLSIWEVTNNTECGCVYFVEMHNVVCHFGGKFKNELLSAYISRILGVAKGICPFVIRLAKLARFLPSCWHQLLHS